MLLFFVLFCVFSYCLPKETRVWEVMVRIFQVMCSWTHAVTSLFLMHFCHLRKWRSWVLNIDFQPCYISLDSLKSPDFARLLWHRLLLCLLVLPPGNQSEIQRIQTNSLCKGPYKLSIFLPNQLSDVLPCDWFVNGCHVGWCLILFNKGQLKT